MTTILIRLVVMSWRRNFRVLGLLLFDRDRLTRESLDLPQLIAFVATAERGGDAGRACAAGPADAVNVNLRHFGQFVVDHVRDAVDV